jgi:hypothetical protein
MKKRPTYFSTKSPAVIRQLITGQGTSKERLRKCGHEILLILSTPIPDDLELQKNKILSAMNKKASIVVKGQTKMSSFDRTLITIKKLLHQK